jgi:hypothetical protein
MPNGVRKKRPQDITSKDKELRIDAVLTLMLQGASIQQIKEYCGKNYKVNQSTAYAYMKAAKTILIENFHKTIDLEGFKAEIYGRLENLYQQNMDIDDFKECRNILKDIREMLGLNAAIKADITSNGSSIADQRPQHTLVLADGRDMQKILDELKSEL